MRNLKKFLALVLAMMMALSLMVTANAATSNVEWKDGDKMDPAFAEAVDVLSGMKVFQGDESGFRPDATITRAEVARIIYRIATGDVEGVREGLYANYGNFDDVRPDAWYAGAIGYGANAGYFKGVGNNMFDPDGKVTGYEALAMILRVIGYDKNNEFTGFTWQTKVSSTATQLHILDNVNTTQYGGTLHLAARRDVIADLLFQTAAFVPQVVYTTAFGYQDTGMNGGVVGTTKNPTIGMQNFGLTANHGVVVGNEVTGEGQHVTKIGFSLDSRTSGTQLGVTVDSLGTITGVTTSNQTSFTTRIDDTLRRGANNGSAYVYASDTANALPENVTRSFKWDTDLRLFGHKVKVWYDCRSNQYETVGVPATGTAQFTTNLTTYAMYDEVVATSVVSADDANLGDGGALRGAATNGWAANVNNNWAAPGFGTTGSAYFNYAFEATVPGRYAADATAAGSAESPVLDNDSADEHNLYLLISNTPGKVLDMVISLDMTFTQIVQANNTTAPYSVGVWTANGGNQYFGVVADNGKVNGAPGTETGYTSLAQGNLRNSPKIDLGTKVAAIEITGTAGPHTAAVNTDGKAWPNAPLTSSFYYQLTENTKKQTATVIKVDVANQNVTLADGTVLHQSVFAEATDGKFMPAAGTNANIDAAPTATTPLQAGREYTFTLDEQGHYIYWETPTDNAKFIYGTYLDFQTQVASSAFTYPLVYVNANGESRQQVNITKENGFNMDINRYATIAINKRDSSTQGNTSGYVQGKYIGYALNGDTVNQVTTSNSQNTGFLQADTTDFGAAPITITKREATLGAMEVAAGSKLYLTENTQFYFVDGAGTANQTVKSVKGLAALMEGMDQVVIDGNTALARTTYLEANATPYDMFYYKAGPFQYAQSYDPSAREVKTVFLPERCVSRVASIESSLVFVGNNASTLVSSIGPHATQFTMYRNGEAASYWMDGWASDANSATEAILANGKNVFYNLVSTGKNAADGNPIYTIRSVNASAVLGKYFDGTVVGTTVTNSTALSPVDYVGEYKATTYSQQVAIITDSQDTLYNVGAAGVKNLNRGTYPGIDDTLASLNNAGSLVNNVGVPVSCIRNTSDVNGLTVSFIYVNA